MSQPVSPGPVARLSAVQPPAPPRASQAEAASFTAACAQAAGGGESPRSGTGTGMPARPRTAEGQPGTARRADIGQSAGPAAPGTAGPAGSRANSGASKARIHAIDHVRQRTGLVDEAGLSGKACGVASGDAAGRGAGQVRAGVPQPAEGTRASTRDKLLSARSEGGASDVVTGGRQAGAGGALPTGAAPGAPAVSLARGRGDHEQKDRKRQSAGPQSFAPTGVTAPVTVHPSRSTDRKGAFAIDAAASATPPQLSSRPTATANFSVGTEVAVHARSGAQNNAALLQSVRALAADGGGSAKVTLHPQSLGTVVVRVNVTPQGVANIQMTASTDSGYQALSANAGKLAQNLARSGLTVGAMQTVLAPNPNAPAGTAGAAQQPTNAGLQTGGGNGAFAGSQQHSGGGQTAGGGHGQPHETPWDSTRAPTNESATDDTVRAYA